MERKSKKEENDKTERQLFYVFVLLSVMIMPIKSQEASLSTNALGWATTTPNIAGEMSVNNQWTVRLNFSYNPWEFGSNDSNKKIKHILVQPEVRRWLYEKYDGHFFGIHAQYLRYNVGGIKFPLNIFSDTKDHRYDGHGVGVGVSYGYQWYLSPHWNLEAVFGFGYNYLDFDKYSCPKCGTNLGKGHKHYFGPTQLGVSVIYLFKSQK